MISETVERWNRDEAEAGVGAAHRSFFRRASTESARALLLHGAGGSPEDFHDMAAFLSDRGWSALCPLLPGHGRDAVALGDVRFGDLLETALSAHELLRDGGRPIAVVAQSLGAVVAAQLAVRSDLRCLVALAPAFRPFVLRRIWLLAVLLFVRPRLAVATWRWQWELLRGIRETRAVLGDVRCPLLVLHSRDDDSVSPRGGAELHDRAGSRSKSLVALRDQGHVLTCAPGREALVFVPTLEFLEASTAGEAGSRTTGPPRGDA